MTTGQACLERIRELYTKARAEAVAGAKHDPSIPDCEAKQICPYCGEWWRKWAGSRLDGHAACTVPEWFKTTLRTELMPRPDLTYRDVARALGVSSEVVRSWTTQRR